MGRTLEDRFSDRLKAIRGTINPNTSTGETVHGGNPLRYKNMSGDWAVENDRVYITAYAITSVSFGPADSSQFKAELRVQSTVKTLINRLVEAAKMGRLFGGHRASFGGQELTPEAYEWVKHNAAVLLRYVKKPGEKSKTPPVNEQLRLYRPPSAMHQAVYRAILDGLQSATAQEAAAQAAQKAATKE